MKKLVMSLIVLTMILGVTGCGKAESKQIAEYKYDKTLVCEAFDKKIKIASVSTDSATIITEDNDIYELDFKKMYSNDTNCTKLDKKFDEEKGTRDFYYGSESITCISNSCEYYEYGSEFVFHIKWSVGDIRNMLTKSGYSRIYVGNNVPYYGTKSDNKIYKVYTNIEDYLNNCYSEECWPKEPVDYHITKEIPVYENPNNEKILDFYLGDGYDPDNIDSNTYGRFILTDKSYYRKAIINKEDCKKYRDVKCKYDWVRDDELSQVRNDILDITDDELLLKNGRLYRSNKSKK